MNYPNQNRISAVMQVVFYAVSVLLIGIAVVITQHVRGFIATSVQCDAVITEITSYRSGEDMRHEVRIEFTLPDGSLVKTSLDAYTGSMRPGQTVQIYYRESKPETVLYAGFPYLAPVILAGVALILSAVAAGFSAVSIRKKCLHRLLDTGAREAVTVTDIRVNPHITVNRVCPTVIYATDISGGVYRSENIYGVVSVVPGEQLYVYIDRAHPKRYFMDWRKEG